jgi:hypothetical protein
MGKADGLKKKVFGASHRVKAGTTNFSWTPCEKAGAFLYAKGREFFLQLYGCPPGRWMKERDGRPGRWVLSFAEILSVIRLGVEVTGWADVDPLWSFAFG